MLGVWTHVSKRNYEAKVVSKVDLDERRRDGRRRSGESEQSSKKARNRTALRREMRDAESTGWRNVRLVEA